MPTTESEWLRGKANNRRCYWCYDILVLDNTDVDDEGNVTCANCGVGAEISEAKKKMEANND